MFETHGIRVPAKSEIKMGPKELADYQKQRRDLKYIRGHFIELITGVEKGIDSIILWCLISKKSKFKQVFKEKILNSRSVSLSTKVEIFKEVVKIGKYLKQKEQEGFFGSLKLLITERNRWAHGSIFYRQEKKQKLQSYLEYINGNGKTCEKRLTNRYFNDLNKKLAVLNVGIEKILIKKKILKK